MKLRFTLYYNKTHKRFGTLWAEKFKSLLLESDSQAVVAVAAYIDLNPVRAGLCRDPKDYRFCGYAEAVAGNKRAREGLGGTIVRSSWREVSREYRMVLFGAGVMSDRSTRHFRGGVLESHRRCRRMTLPAFDSPGVSRHAVEGAPSGQLSSQLLHFLQKKGSKAPNHSGGPRRA